MANTLEYKPKSLWADLFRKIAKDKMALLALTVVVTYSLLAILVATGIVGSDWTQEVGSSYAPPSSEHWFGTDIFGRSVFQKTLQGTQVAMSVGLITSVIAILIGVTLGAVGGYFGGRIDEAVVWFSTTISSIPNIMLLIAVTFILGKGILAIYLALGLTGWVGLCRLIRAEVIRHKDREYVQAAYAIGGGHGRRLFLHILPNVVHIVIISFSLNFEVAIKSEVILSYLGLGIQGRPSWGTMIDDAKLELARGVWWQLAAASFAMFLVVLSLNVLSDTIRDALDPKLKGK